MKQIFSFLLFFHCYFINAQTFTYKVNDAVHTFNKSNTLSANYKDGQITIAVDVSANYKTGTWADIELVIIGKNKGIYLLGEAASEKYNNTGSENGTARLQVNYCDAANENHTKDTYMKDQERTTGSIRITSIVNKSVSGNFSVNIAGVIVQGSFADIEVKGL